ncbi:MULTISPECIES: hypothetical protein [Microbacterium]|uniref:hypothetical protein n=1 Tax=Microbacterium TaxID=33882 RepID=UPI0027D867AB|nr:MULTISPECIES: hypothetical protein [Microbacterium]
MHDSIGHDGPDAAQPLVEFDDGLDEGSERAGRRYHSEVAKLAADFLDATEGPVMDGH